MTRNEPVLISAENGHAGRRERVARITLSLSGHFLWQRLMCFRPIILDLRETRVARAV
jgi:hypothetical protein